MGDKIENGKRYALHVHETSWAKHNKLKPIVYFKAEIKNQGHPYKGLYIFMNQIPGLNKPHWTHFTSGHEFYEHCYELKSSKDLLNELL